MIINLAGSSKQQGSDVSGVSSGGDCDCCWRSSFCMSSVSADVEMPTQVVLSDADATAAADAADAVCVVIIIYTCRSEKKCECVWI